MNIGGVFLGVVFTFAGILGIQQAIRDARTSTDKETGTWSIVSFLLVLTGLTVFIFSLGLVSLG